MNALLLAAMPVVLIDGTAPDPDHWLRIEPAIAAAVECRQALPIHVLDGIAPNAPGSWALTPARSFTVFGLPVTRIELFIDPDGELGARTEACQPARAHRPALGRSAQRRGSSDLHGRRNGARVSIQRILSGGQTGVDRAALDFAIARQIPHGGWCPAGRRAADGVLDARYQLMETESSGYRQRTKRNVLDADATLIIYRDRIEGGSLLTRDLATSEARNPGIYLQASALLELFWSKEHEPI